MTFICLSKSVCELEIYNELHGYVQCQYIKSYWQCTGKYFQDINVQIHHQIHITVVQTHLIHVLYVCKLCNLQPAELICVLNTATTD